MSGKFSLDDYVDVDDYDDRVDVDCAYAHEYYVNDDGVGDDIDDNVGFDNAIVVNVYSE